MTIMQNEGVTERINIAIERGMLPLVLQTPMTMPEWADEYFYLSAESSSIEGKWTTLPYQWGILDCFGSDEVRKVTVFKPARIGYTKCLDIAIGYFASHKKRSQVLYQPTDTDAKDFVSDEIDPMLRDVSVVGDIMVIGHDKKGSGNTKQRKEFIGSVLDIKGGKSARNYRRMTKDVVYFDETDGFVIDVDGEGSPISLGDVRVSTSSFPKSIRGSTPSTEGNSLIQSSFEDANIVLKRYVPCPDCGKFHYFEWSNMQWVDDDAQSARMACVFCGSLTPYQKYPAMDAAGRWGSEDGIWLENGGKFYDGDGNRVDTPEHVAFSFWSAYSHFIPWSNIVQLFIDANRAKKRGDISKLKTFTNTQLAELWTEEGSIMNASPLMDRREAYGPDVPEGVLVITAGIDVQEDRVEVEIVGWGAGYESWNLDYQVIDGITAIPPDGVGGGQVWKKLDELLLSVLEHENGAKMRIVSACVDAGFATQNVYKFCKARLGRKVVASRGIAGAGKRIAGDMRTSKKYNAQFMPIGVDTAKDMLYYSLKQEVIGPNYSHFPLQRDQVYFNQLTSEKRVNKYVKGKRVIEWVIKPGIRNEAMDCRNYARAAVEMLDVNMDKIQKVMDKKTIAHKARVSANAITPPSINKTVDARPAEVRVKKRRRMISKGIS